MKATIVIFGLIALASATRKAAKPDFRNQYKATPEKLVFRIIEGEEAFPNSFKHQAFIVIIYRQNSRQPQYCGGSLITWNYVVTAAHCVDRAVRVIIVLGAHRPSEYEDTQQVFHSSQFKMHENYVQDIRMYDIAVVRLPVPAVPTDAVQLIGLPPPTADFVGRTGFISGWGRGGTDNTLHFATVQIISKSECETYLGPLHSSVLCTFGDNNKGICHGDSGGPLSVDGQLVGIISFVKDKTCPAGFPSAYAKVTTLLDWIRANTDVYIPNYRI